MNTTQRLENSIRNQPSRWIVERNKESRELLKAWDRDTGRLFIREGEGWFWID